MITPNNTDKHLPKRMVMLAKVSTLILTSDNYHSIYIQLVLSNQHYVLRLH
jgi:hypothetical protein